MRKRTRQPTRIRNTEALRRLDFTPSCGHDKTCIFRCTYAPFSVRLTRRFRAPTILFPNPQLLHFGVFATKPHTVSNHAHNRDESIVHFAHCGGGRRCFQRRIVFTVINGRRNYHPVLNEHCSFVTGEEFKLGIPCRPLRASCSALVASGGFYGGIWGHAHHGR